MTRVASTTVAAQASHRKPQPKAVHPGMTHDYKPTGPRLKPHQAQRGQNLAAMFAIRRNHNGRL